MLFYWFLSAMNIYWIPSAFYCMLKFLMINHYKTFLNDYSVVGFIAIVSLLIYTVFFFSTIFAWLNNWLFVIINAKSKKTKIRFALAFVRCADLDSLVSRFIIYPVRKEVGGFGHAVGADRNRWLQTVPKCLFQIAYRRILSSIFFDSGEINRIDPRTEPLKRRRVSQFACSSKPQLYQTSYLDRFSWLYDFSY